MQLSIGPGAANTKFQTRGLAYTTDANGFVTYTVGATGTNDDIHDLLAMGFVPVTEPSVDGLTAKAGGGQANATPLTGIISRVTTVGTAADSSKLPVSVAGLSVTVVNAAAANSMNVFPQTGEAINALGANAAYALAAGKTATFYCTTAGQWHALLSA